MPNVSLVASRCVLFVGLGVSPIRAIAARPSLRDHRVLGDNPIGQYLMFPIVQRRAALGAGKAA